MSLYLLIMEGIAFLFSVLLLRVYCYNKLFRDAQGAIDEKYIVKKDSFIRKIPGFKWKEPSEDGSTIQKQLMYIKVIPFLIQGAIFICVYILYGVALIFPGSIFALFFSSEIVYTIGGYVLFAKISVLTIIVAILGRER